MRKIIGHLVHWRRFARSLFLLGAGAAAISTHAVTLSQPVQLIARVGSTCLSATATSLNFGMLVAATTTSVLRATATASLSIDCSNGTPFSVTSNAGANAGSGSQKRLRLGATGAYVNYAIYKNSQLSDAFPTTGGVNGVGSITPLTVPVYGEIVAQAVTSAGAYADTLVFTVSF
jgi:spore coat protein U-like protein